MEQSWLQMLRDRNETSHVYDEEKARYIYENIVGYFPEMKETFKFLKEKYKEGGSESYDD
ncbi:nucleotidyltransferase substrate binding protein [Oceanobacillus jeddahense]|uniref:Nucleotidyltransferase substrate binding protein n=2 Tax=Oceanobacillus jeddahense TaxID=1462527 RepID=A0ABY5JXN4_9BACI|nr:nucleotidyltransferase substrate binding protein [Oceanobacillus jeddahense]UUI04889.1 nucleotidyltransferase substrate binding protein [Oceanobacillus jeddahense]